MGEILHLTSRGMPRKFLSRISRTHLPS